MALLFDSNEIRKAIGILKPDNALFEIRILRGYKVYSGYFRDAETLINALCRIDPQILEHGNIYITLQELHPGCEARTQWQQFLDTRSEKFPTTSDNDVLRYRFLPIDIDPVRPAEISSTEEELTAAAATAGEVLAFMVENGWNNYITACSGNGYHLLFPCDIPVSERDVIETQLSALSDLFSNDRAKIDTTLSNPSRILKLYGTVARKGRSTEQRPHRISRILKVHYENT